MGRFISPDTILDGLNRYAYCGNNPINYVDPTGNGWEPTGGPGLYPYIWVPDPDPTPTRPGEGSISTPSENKAAAGGTGSSSSGTTAQDNGDKSKPGLKGDPSKEGGSTDVIILPPSHDPPPRGDGGSDEPHGPENSDEAKRLIISALAETVTTKPVVEFYPNQDQILRDAYNGIKPDVDWRMALGLGKWGLPLAFILCLRSSTKPSPGHPPCDDYKNRIFVAHFTSKEGAAAIMASMTINPSSDVGNPWIPGFVEVMRMPASRKDAQLAGATFTDMKIVMWVPSDRLTRNDYSNSPKAMMFNTPGIQFIGGFFPEPVEVLY